MSTAAEQAEALATAEDLLRMPSDARYELIQGRLCPMAPTGDAHGSLTYDLAWEVGAFIRQHGIGRGFAAETGFLVAHSPDSVLAPDFAFVAKDRLPDHWTGGYLPIAPDLVLETRSPSDTARDVNAKVARWLGAGVRLVWDLDPKRRRLTVHRPSTPPITLGIDDTLEGYDVLPGFTLPLRRLFRAPDGAGQTGSRGESER